MSKKLFIKTLGCQMNSRDTEHIIAELKTHKNYDVTQNYDNADLIIINTCSVRERPVSKLFSELGSLNKNKKINAKIGVCGCTASHLGEDIIKRAPYVDFVLGARNISKISKVVDIKGSVEIDINHDETIYEFSQYRDSAHKASINISLGCDKTCSYCIVPATRGKEISIPSDIILNEIKKVVKTGVKEVCLLGQNVNNYGLGSGDKEKSYNFTSLLRSVSKIDEIKRIRFTSPHPLHMDDEFIKEFISNSKICKSIHVPLQSGSTNILKQMRRGYSKENFLKLCKKIRKLSPDTRISTDIIVGFPGESDKDFEDTIDVVREIKFDQIFNFKYSPRPNTSALAMDDLVEEEVKSERLQSLINLHKSHQDELMKKYKNNILSVYFEDLKPNGEVMGFSDNYLQVYVDGSEELIGKIVDVKIISNTRTSLRGVLA